MSVTHSQPTLPMSWAGSREHASLSLCHVPAIVFADWETFSVLRLSAFRCRLYCLLCASGKVNSFSWASVSSAIKLRPCCYLPQRVPRRLRQPVCEVLNPVPGAL